MAYAVLAHSIEQTARQIRRSKITYCLGFLCCFIVVSVAAVMQTVLGKAPIIFLREAETSAGQIDVTITPEDASLFNYDTFVAKLEQAPNAAEFKHNSGRLQYAANAIGVTSCRAGAASQAAPSPTASTATKNMAALASTVAANASINGDWAYGTGCRRAVSRCVRKVCGGSPQSSPLYVIDTAREKAAGIGREWPYPAIPEGSVYMRAPLAQELNVSRGDALFLQVSLSDQMPLLFRAPTGPNATTAEDWKQSALKERVVSVRVTVAELLPDTMGKLERDIGPFILMEMATFVPYMLRHAHPSLRAATPSPTSYASTVALNLPPQRRLEVYQASDYDTIQASLIRFSSQAVFYLDVNAVQAVLPLLLKLRSRRFLSLYLSLVLDILIAILFALSTILVYSLLMIDVQARNHELAVRRMVGTTRSRVVLLVLVQAFAYSVPAWILGMIVSTIGSRVLLAAFSRMAQIPVTGSLSVSGFVAGTVLGTAIPAVAAVGPIRVALGQQLRDALDVTRAKTASVKYNIERAGDQGVSWAVVAAGSATAFFGFLIYYLLPLSLLTLNLKLFFNIFFWILLGMLAGLVLLGLNLENSLERGVVALFLFWENPIMRTLTLKNLVAHRERNRKTTMMYALSLAFIVFITVAANMELQTQDYQIRQRAGATLTLQISNPYGAEPAFPAQPRPAAVLTSLHQQLAPLRRTGIVTDVSLVSFPLSDTLAYAGLTGVDTSNVGRVYSESQQIVAVTPNFLSTVYPEFLTVEERRRPRSALSLSQQLYTAAGSQGMVVSTSYKKALSASVTSPVLLSLSFAQQQSPTEAEVFLAAANGDTAAATSADTAPASGAAFAALGGGGGGSRVDRYPMFIQAFVSAMAGFRFSKFSTNSDTALVSFPTYVRLSAGLLRSVSQVPVRRALVQLSPTATAAEVDAVAAQLQRVASQPDASGARWLTAVSVEDTRAQADDLAVTITVLNFFFNGLTVVGMLLCFFSLLASMVSNIHEQSKDIAVLHALGLRALKLVLLFVYEAFTLVFAASLLGVAIGTAVAWTFLQQRTLFTQLPVPFYLPLPTIAAVVVTSAVCAVLSAALPASRLTRKPIARLMRAVS